MTRGIVMRTLSTWHLFTLSIAVVVSSTPAFSSVRYLSGHIPAFTRTAPDLGPVDPKMPLSVRVWLKLRNPKKLAKLADEKMSSRSGNHDWITPETFASEFKPTEKQIEQVRLSLLAQGVGSVTVDQSHRYLTIASTVGALSQVFGVTFHNFSLNGRIVRANLNDPRVDESISGLIKKIGGLSNHPMKPHIAHPINLETGLPVSPTPLKSTTPSPDFESVCFRDSQTVTFSTSGAAPKAIYSGNRYGSDVTDTTVIGPCGYSPTHIQAAYGMKELYAQGLDGSGETVVIVDAFGSPSVTGDSAFFNSYYQLSAVDLTVYQPGGAPVTGPWNADQQSWAFETTLDVEWLHSMAPGAKLALVEAYSDENDDLLAANAYAVDHHLGNIISNSWGEPESYLDDATLSLYNEVLQSAFVQGVAINVSSGDSGDFVSAIGYADVSFPSDMPYVTSIGGTSLALNADDSIKFQTGWGNNYTRLANSVASPAASAATTNTPVDPPLSLGFLFGASGGTSRIYQKPQYQNKLSGTMRKIPDISYLADPYTGVPIIESGFDANGNPVVGALGLSTVGGTSLACPLFSGLWAIANQAGGQSMGPAAPLLYDLPSYAISDVTATGSNSNVSGTLTDSTGTNLLTPFQLSLPETTTPFFSALYDSPFSPFRWYNLTFGTDSSLPVGPGWDPVTGLGTPNGAKFVSAITN